MPLVNHQRISVHKPGDARHGVCGSVVEVTATGAYVVLEQGLDQQSGGQLTPEARTHFLEAELPPK